MKKQICELLDISDVSYYRWKQDRLIISFLEKYFTETEITEYIQTKKIKKLELIKDYSSLELNEKLNGSKGTVNIPSVHGSGAGRNGQLQHKWCANDNHARRNSQCDNQSRQHQSVNGRCTGN